MVEISKFKDAAFWACFWVTGEGGWPERVAKTLLLHTTCSYYRQTAYLVKMASSAGGLRVKVDVITALHVSAKERLRVTGIWGRNLILQGLKCWSEKPLELFIYAKIAVPKRGCARLESRGETSSCKAGSAGARSLLKSSSTLKLQCKVRLKSP